MSGPSDTTAGMTLKQLERAVSAPWPEIDFRKVPDEMLTPEGKEMKRKQLEKQAANLRKDINE